MEYKRIDCEYRTTIDIECDDIKYQISKYKLSNRIKIIVCYTDGKELHIDQTPVIVNYTTTVRYTDNSEITYRNDSIDHLFNIVTQPTMSIEETFQIVKTIIDHSLIVKQAKIEYDAIVSRDVRCKNYSKR